MVMSSPGAMAAAPSVALFTIPPSSRRKGTIGATVMFNSADGCAPGFVTVSVNVAGAARYRLGMTARIVALSITFETSGTAIGSRMEMVALGATFAPVMVISVSVEPWAITFGDMERLVAPRA